MAKDLLFEIGTEEIPARFMAGALSQLENIARNKFNELRVGYRDIQVLGTPRRLALIVRDVVEEQADKNSENKGPSIKIAFDANHLPTKAAQGFARGQGVDPVDLVVKDGYVYALVHEVGKPVSTLLPEILSNIIDSLNFPKNMRWADFDRKFVRPIRWIVALFGSEVIPFTITKVSTGNVTRGHRFLSKGELIVNSVDDYFTVLQENYVMVNQEERRSVIREQVQEIALSQGGTAAIDEDLLEEVVYLVEYPTALCGRFEEKYLSLPPEAVITPMREHQRYFPVVSKDGKLLPVFITVRNGSADHIDIVRHGNERVLKARLADAQFFFEEDKKIKLIDRLDKLKTIVFQEGLGTVYDKTIRIEHLALAIAKFIGTENVNRIIERSAKLAKADLVTGMVCEFTELQGTMGKEYALLNGEQPEVAQAIFEHYLPRFAGDILPESVAGKVISIADKLDNIVATFSRGLIPTGSQDPYALRRQALGIVNILIDSSYHVSMNAMLVQTMDLLGIVPEKREKLLIEIQEFFRLRIKNVLADENIRYDIVDAVMGTSVDDVYDTWLRAKAMVNDGGSSEMQKAVQAFTRVGNLVKNVTDVQAIDESLFTVDEERVLYFAYKDAYEDIQSMTERKDYCGILNTMITMTEPIDAFFGAVMVMVEDIAVKNNRLALLKRITDLTTNVADLSKIVAL
ncbi:MULTISPECIES: glycine--tRNA ligase subunit beta [Pelosinus]|uniref:Glycine--tRNA ligase beta subunit n=1 Tax=Pelosinus fermentans B4 TaxID=1149862 RepID=I8RDA4_9FIRM|nr:MULTISPECIES: glycine--tRNA ligase subunit beta [Pelosinus]EIW17223.1 glycyl-tRNA synthetase, beta subunit [Pelosinus fermentans B4]EIW22978.1 Glycyl-tRNA synthetase beta subunit [Pelosinus fermentans A11]OAM93981.1 Glycyl-tRNA synthetase beta subunit [Pelosinus fermentans DSM 17108]SDQ96205.1 glycyl-tRNA synthetase beta chain [Pelosinus fermentans]